MATGRLPDPNSAPVTAKGDLYTYSTVPAKLAVGSNGETLVADSSATTGLRWNPTFAAGKNLIINGGFDIWQRGTSFSTATFPTFYADRWLGGTNGTSVTRTVSQQTFTPGAAPVAGYEGQYFLRVNQSVAGSGAVYNALDQRIEDVRTGAGQTVTLSFWAKTAAAKNINIELNQSFGSGGSADVTTTVVSGQSISTSWTRYSFTVALPSISGKTIGTNNYLLLRFSLPLNDTFTFDLWGVQFEVGSTATAFTKAGGTLAGELAACQRYYYRITTSAAYGDFGAGYQKSTTVGSYMIPFPVIMRTAPTALEQSGTASQYNILHQSGGAGTRTTCSAVPTFQVATTAAGRIDATVSSGLTAGNGGIFGADNNTTAYLAWSAEL